MTTLPFWIQRAIRSGRLATCSLCPAPATTIGIYYPTTRVNEQQLRLLIANRDGAPVAAYGLCSDCSQNLQEAAIRFEEKVIRDARTVLRSMPTSGGVQ